MKLYNYCVSQPEIPDVAMSFSDADVKAYVDGNSQRTNHVSEMSRIESEITRLENVAIS